VLQRAGVKHGNFFSTRLLSLNSADTVPETTDIFSSCRCSHDLFWECIEYPYLTFVLAVPGPDIGQNICYYY